MRWGVGLGTVAALRKIGPRSPVGVVGLGGLGHLAVKFAVALGASVDVFTTSATKSAAAKLLGADNVVLATDVAQMAAARGRCDFVLDTVAVPHKLSEYLGALRSVEHCVWRAPWRRLRGEPRRFGRSFADGFRWLWTT